MYFLWLQKEEIVKKTATINSFLYLIHYFCVSGNMQVQKALIFKLIRYMFDKEHVFLI